MVGTEPRTHVVGERLDCFEGIGGDRLDGLVVEGGDFCSLGLLGVE